MYIIYELDDDLYYAGGRNWSRYVSRAYLFDNVGQVKAAIRKLEARSPQLNMIYQRY